MCQKCSIALISSENKDSWSKFLPNILVKYWIKHLALSILMKTRAWRVITITHSGATYVFGPCMVHPSNIIYENWSCQSIIGLAACCIFLSFSGWVTGKRRYIAKPYTENDPIIHLTVNYVPGRDLFYRGQTIVGIYSFSYNFRTNHDSTGHSAPVRSDFF